MTQYMESIIEGLKDFNDEPDTIAIALERVQAVVKVEMISAALQACGGSPYRAATVLGCSRQMIYDAYADYPEIRARVKINKPGNPGTSRSKKKAKVNG